MKLFVGLITYGESSLKYLEEGLASLSSALYFLSQNDYSVVIFDNSENYYLNQEFIAKNYPNFQVIAQNRNFGFAKSYNHLLQLANQVQAEYFLMINPDLLLEKDAVKKLVESLDKDAELFSVCPKLYRWPFPEKPKEKIIDTCGLLLLPGLRFVDLGQGKVDDGSFDDLEILGPSGAAALFRMSALNKISIAGEYFDERMFMYKEDCDLAYRLFLAGGKSICVKEAIAWHDRTAADPGRGIFAALEDRKNKSQKVRRWSFANQHLIYAKYFKKQNLFSKIKIIASILSMFIFVLFKERFILPEYRAILSKIHKKHQ